MNAERRKYLLTDAAATNDLKSKKLNTWISTSSGSWVVPEIEPYILGSSKTLPKKKSLSYIRVVVDIKLQ